jgi:hypothetical protein
MVASVAMKSMSTLMMMTVHREAITRNDDEVNYMMMIVI